MRPLCALLAGLLLMSLNGGCRQEPPAEPLRLSGQTMGTTWSVALLPPPAGIAAPALQQLLQARLDQINTLMSTYAADSEISRFNSLASTDWFPLSADTAQVIALSQEVSVLTGGAFDISVGPLVDLWGFGAAGRGEGVPAEQQVREALSRVGYQKISLRREPAAIRKQTPGLRIDLSAVAKGYAVDALAGLLERQGVSSFMVEIGGELRLSGRRGDGSPWRIAIEQPLEDRREVATTLLLTETALATSGNYRNFYLHDGQRFAHTIDPASGRPIRHRLASVTVLDQSCARADALATALMVLGEEQGRRLCEQQDIAAYFLIHDQAALVAYASPAFQRFVEKARQ